MRSLKTDILIETFDQSFSFERYRKFVLEFFNAPEMLLTQKHEVDKGQFAELIESYNFVAHYTDCEGNNMLVLAVELSRATSVGKARGMQRGFISKILDDNNYEAAIVAFYNSDEPNWRLSFVKLDYSFNEQGIKLEITPVKRYSYLVGENEPNNTAIKQLLPIFNDDKHNPTIKSIEEAFSVEKVTKDFFNQYREKYLQLKEFLEKNTTFIEECKKLGLNVPEFSEQFSKKLLGQLSFLYFLQKKGWLGVKHLPSDKYFTNGEYSALLAEKGQDYSSVIDKILFTDLNGKQKIKSLALLGLDDHETELLSDFFSGTAYDLQWGTGDKRFIRTLYDYCNTKGNMNFFVEMLEPLFYNALNKKRKNHYFKNFNCKIPFLNGGLFEPIEGYHWQDIHLDIPNELFSNVTEKGLNADGILDIFDRFNFTMNEDEPLEKEVAVDPEMLGKIFENLLEVNDRKSKGAFYTPREIVHTMCQESLINYLLNEISLPKDDIEEFILFGEIISSADSSSKDDKTKTLMVKDSILDNIVAIDDALKRVKIADPAVGSGAFPLGMLNEIIRARSNITEYIIMLDQEGKFDRHFGETFIRKWRSIYKMKWDTIRDCIFAVDIEPSAVDITKLRLWLSVVVDQEIDSENPEPHPLPNLDMNIHIGNSLVDEYQGIKLFDDSILDGVSKKKKTGKQTKIEQLRLFFDSDEILKEMFEKQNQYFEEVHETNKKNLMLRVENLREELITFKLRESGKISELEKFIESKSLKHKPYFIWELEFAKVFKESKGFDILIGNPPYGADLTKSDQSSIKKNLTDTNNMNTAAIFIDFAKNNWIKPGGIVSFIVPKSLLFSEKWLSLAKALSKHTSVLIDVEKAFEKVKLEQVVFVMNESIESSFYLAKKFVNNSYINIIQLPTSIIDEFNAWICDITDRDKSIVENIYVKTDRMLDISDTKRGVGVQKYIKKIGTYEVIGGKNVQRFRIDGFKGYLNRDLVESKTRKFEFMMQPKIISQDIIAHIQNPAPHIRISSTYDELGTVIGLDTVQNTVLYSDDYDYRFIVGLLNSNFINWYTYKFIYCAAIRTMHFDKKYIGKIIIPKVSKDNQQYLVEIVKELEVTEQEIEHDVYEKLISKLNTSVYDLFGINNEDRMYIEFR